MGWWDGGMEKKEASADRVCGSEMFSVFEFLYVVMSFPCFLKTTLYICDEGCFTAVCSPLISFGSSPRSTLET